MHNCIFQDYYFFKFLHLSTVMQKRITYVKKTYYNINMHNFKYVYVIYFLEIVEEM